jgi:catechol 2,3-dioxygenase-like lactoylglutathione lyase family enzyme
VRITDLTLHTPNLEAQRAFYMGVMGFPLAVNDAAPLALRVGFSVLRFVPGEVSGPYHFAFNVPETRFVQARAWLEERVTPLADEAGETTFHSENWNADNTYFRDADGNILEFIARHTLPASAEAGEAFGMADIPGVSELGVVVDSVPDAVQDLSTRFGLPIYSEASPTFTALGDEEGLLIVVPVGRAWFPTGEPARRLPFHLRAHHGSGSFDFEERP